MSSYTSLADALSRIEEQRGNALARGAEQRGQIWGNAIGGLGSLIAGIPEQRARLAEAQQRQQIGAMQLDAAKRAQVSQQKANQIIAGLPRNADNTYDAGALIQQLAGANVPLEDQERYAKSIDGMNQVISSFNQQKHDKLADAADQFLSDHPASQPITPDATHLWFAMMKDNGLQNDQDEQKLTALIGQGADPRSLIEGVRAQGSKYQSARAKLQEPVKLGPGENLIIPATGKTLASGGQKPITNQMEAALRTVAKDPANPTPEESAQALKMVRPEEPVVTVRTMENGKPVEKVLPRSQAVGQTFASQPPASVIYPNPQGEQAVKDVKESVAAMKDGTAPPLLPGRATKEYLATIAEAHRQGFDLAAANTDWNATQKHIATLNGQQQTRLRQSINALPELLDSVDALASKWNAGRYPLLNKANLALAKGGAFGKDAATIANQLDSQIADVTADLGNVYMGGNSPTDHALELASKSLNTNWDRDVLKNMVTLARQNVRIRQNSIRNTGVAGASDNNPYAAPAPPAVLHYDPATGTVK